MNPRHITKNSFYSKTNSCDLTAATLDKLRKADHRDQASKREKKRFASQDECINVVSCRRHRCNVRTAEGKISPPFPPLSLSLSFYLFLYLSLWLYIFTSLSLFLSLDRSFYGLEPVSLTRALARLSHYIHAHFT